MLLFAEKNALCRFLQAGLISPMTFDEKLGFPTANHKRIYKLIKDLISDYWKDLLRIEISFKKFLLQQ